MLSKKFLFMIIFVITQCSFLKANKPQLATLSQLPIKYFVPQEMFILSKQNPEGIPFIHFKDAISDSYELNATALEAIIKTIYGHIELCIIPLLDDSKVHGEPTKPYIIEALNHLIAISHDITKIVEWIAQRKINRYISTSRSNELLKNQFVKTLFGIYYMNAITACEIMKDYGDQLTEADRKSDYEIEVSNFCSEEQESIWTKISSDYSVFFEELWARIATE